MTAQHPKAARPWPGPGPDPSRARDPGDSGRTNPFTSRIGRKLAVTFLFMVILPCLAIGLSALYILEQSGRSHAVDRLSATAIHKENEVTGWAWRVQTDLALALHGDAVRKALPALLENGKRPRLVREDIQDLRRHLRDFILLTGRLDALLVLDPTGRVVLSTTPAQEGEFRGLEAWFRAGLDNPGIHFVDHSLAPGTDASSSVAVSHPIQAPDGRILGVLAGMASLNKLNEIMGERTGVGRTGETYLVGPDRILLTESRFAGYRAGSVFVHTQAVEAALAGENGFGMYPDYRGIPVVGVHLWLPALGAVLVAEQDQAEAFAPVRATVTAVLAVGVVALLLAVAGTLYIHRDIVTPVTGMADIARRIASGDLSLSAQVSREDEIGALARAFNRMTANLSRRITMDELIAALSRRFIALDCGRVDAAIGESLEEIGMFIGADRAVRFSLAASGEAASRLQVWSRIGTRPGAEAGFPACPWYQQRLGQQDPVFIPAVLDLPDQAAVCREFWADQGIGALIGLPLTVQGEPRGLIEFQAAQPQPLWSDQDLRIMVMYGEMVCNALARRAAEEATRASEERYRTIADYNYDWESWIGPDRSLLYVSPSCERITGYPPALFLQDPAFIERLIHQDDLPLWKDYMGDETRVEGDAMDFRIFRRDGRMRWVSQVSRRVYDQQGKHLGLRASMRDITDRKFMEKQLEYESLHDPLTGLPNRVLCLDRIKRAMDRSKRRDNYFYAVVFMDLDRFKIINDSLGHSVGDWLLVETSERLLKGVRELDTVSRFGGDEFILLLEDLTMPREAIRIIRRIQRILAEPFVLQDHEIKVTASFGLVLSPTGYAKAEDLLQHANIAMHRVKETGRGHMKVFTSRMLEMAIQRMTLESEVRRAIAAGEFFLEFQPIVDLPTGRPVGFETLIRWNHPQRGLVPPGEFIPTAEETGLILDLGAWVLRQSCLTLARWTRELPQARDLFVSVNISGRQFTAVDLVEQVRKILDETGIPARCLKLEITETSIMERAESSVEKLTRLRQLGVTLSVDDFGTGYSSLSYLQRFPLDVLKIDLSFVRGIDHSQENLEIVRAIINLAHNLGLKVVAEGMERDSQREALLALGCEFGQGYMFARPMSADKALAALTATGDRSAQP